MPNLPVTLSIDAADLARLAPATSNDELLREVSALFKRIDQRLADAQELLIDGREAARRLGISRRTLDGLDIPSVKIGAARRWNVETLREWAKAREHAAALA